MNSPFVLHQSIIDKAGQQLSSIFSSILSINAAAVHPAYFFFLRGRSLIEVKQPGLFRLPSPVNSSCHFFLIKSSAKIKKERCYQRTLLKCLNNIKVVVRLWRTKGGRTPLEYGPASGMLLFIYTHFNIIHVLSFL